MRVLSLAFVWSFALGTNSDSTLSKALVLMQTQQKAEALPLLEKAFAESKTDAQRLEVAGLILEIAPSKYPKLETYLRFLVKTFPSDPSFSKWNKDLGDFYFDRGDFVRAFSTYESGREKAPADQKLIFVYKEAWVNWNLKRYDRALSQFIEVFRSTDGGLKTQVSKDIGKIWWERGRITPESFNSLASQSDANKKILMEGVFKVAPVNSTPTEREVQMIRQLSEDLTFKKAFEEQVQKNFSFKKDPCFFIDQKMVLQVSSDTLLSCIKRKQHPSVSALLPFFDSGEKSEKLDWARADLLIQSHQTSEAIIYLFHVGFTNKSDAYVKFIEDLLLKSSRADLTDLVDKIPEDEWKSYLEMSPKLSETQIHILWRLEAIKPETWMAYEESRWLGVASSAKDFWIRKGIWVAESPSFSDETRNKVLADIVAKLQDLVPSLAEGNFLASLATLKTAEANILPKDFAEDFRNQFLAWLQILDASVKMSLLLPPNLRVIYEPLLKFELQKSVELISSQIDAAQLPPDLPKSVIREFLKKKSSLKSDLKKKYLQVPKNRGGRKK